MASIRFCINSEFNLVDSKVGIGTTNPTELVDVRGQIYSDNSIGAGGISTVTTYQGFLDTKQTIKSSVSEGTVVAGSLSGEIIVEGEVTVSSGTTYTSGIENLTVIDNFTLPGISDDKPSIGDIRFNENLGVIQVYVGGPEEPITGVGGSYGSPYFPTWRAVNSYVDMGNNGSRGFQIGGYKPGIVHKYVQTFNFATGGETTFFGNPAMSNPYETAGFGSKIRAFNATDGSYTQQIDFYTVATQSDGIDFGNLTGNYGYGGALSSQTRGLISAGYGHPSPAANQNVIDYIQMSTLGNALDFGDNTRIGNSRAGLSDGVRGVWAGNGGSPYPSTRVDLNIISTTGNAVNYGDLSHQWSNAGASNSVRGILANLDGLESYNLASGGNSVDFGNRSENMRQPNCTASHTRVVIAGGRDNASPSQTFTDVLDYVTIASTGNSINFGNLSDVTASGAGYSDSHGGLGGF